MQDKLKEIIKFYGEDNQELKAIEEMSELTKAILKGNVNDIKQEMADVFVMILQLKIIYKISDEEIEQIMISKIDRTLDLINNKLPK